MKSDTALLSAHSGVVREKTAKVRRQQERTEKSCVTTTIGLSCEERLKKTEQWQFLSCSDTLKPQLHIM